MPRVNVIYEIEPEYPLTETNEYEIKIGKDKIKNIKITERVFDLMISEGMLKKTDDGYVFVGKYNDIKKFKKK